LAILRSDTWKHRQTWSSGSMACRVRGPRSGGCTGRWVEIACDRCGKRGTRTPSG
jgi:hypothetical protein